jgi:hypothetical protein
MEGINSNGCHTAKRQVVLSVNRPMLADSSTIAVVMKTTFVESSGKAEREQKQHDESQTSMGSTQTV